MKAYRRCIYETCKEKLPDTKLIRAHTGQEISFGSSYVEILYTAADYLPAAKFDYVNSASMVIRVNIKGDSILLLADTTHSSGRILENMYSSHLQSDMVQLAHHGMAPSNTSLYTAIKAPVLLWPTHTVFAKDFINSWRGTISEALSYAKDVYISDSGVTTVTLPYTFVNNKDSVLGELQ